jgi:hypothetical protein
MNFVLDLKHLFPEVYEELIEHFNHLIKTRGEPVVPALLRDYRK